MLGNSSPPQPFRLFFVIHNFISLVLADADRGRAKRREVLSYRKSFLIFCKEG
jgi:hypothetical protein